MAPTVGPYTPIVRAGDLLVVSGQVGLRDGQLVAGGLQAELDPGARTTCRRCSSARAPTSATW